ncbi:rsbT co-antagonist protein RsbR [Mesobacillus persicus]|uniref:RsbT co-antagonist protein RsbR n=1 Tax=Mesobacillus persicus TaxID=930146 RepID=A0A1H8DH10_9BACI|nr:STAS domain-containing protein [Mesobacillus persicus]SEN06476.1 rsbT co-antagonist protein RsbR [Mesobacillus persicus]
MSNIQYLPYPCFVVDEELSILEYSNEALSLFRPVPAFLDLVDSESEDKARKLLSGRNSSPEGEIIMCSINSPQALFTVRINWKDGKGYIICIEKDESLNSLIKMVEIQRQRLADTDFELFEKKEQLQESLKSIRDLSGPFIKLSKKAALIPLFGDLDEQLIQQNAEKFTREASEGDYDFIIFDFNGIGKVEKAGIDEFNRLIGQLKLIGAQSIITGVHPQHATTIHHATNGIQATFINRLINAIKKNVNIDDQ